MTYYVYIITNIRNTVFYIGVTNNLQRRIFEHEHALVEGFTKKYNVKKLVWYETFEHPAEAIRIEKKLKGWKRVKKIDLIRKNNPDFKDLMKSYRDPSLRSG